MDDPSALLVPIRVDALLVNGPVAAGAFERWSNDWSRLDGFADPVPPPWGSTTEVPLGVHLHWRLPSALTHGVAPAGSTTAAFPPLPSRWLVVRLVTPAEGTAAPTATAWVVESDYLDPDLGTTPWLDPSSTPTLLKTTLLGRHGLVADWKGETGARAPFLTATGIADPGFLAYQPGLMDVYAFVDDATGLPENSHLTYLVSGWYADPDADPLVRQPDFDPSARLLTALDWLVLGGTAEAAAPTRSVFHGLVNDLLWQTGAAPPRVDSDASAMQVALGYTAIDALAAMLAHEEGDAPVPAERLETMLAAFQYDCLALLDAPDAVAQLETRIRDGWFGTTPGGTRWRIVPLAQGRSSADPLAPAAQPVPAALDDAQAIWLAELNRRQLKLDEARRALVSRQGTLFGLWWKAQYLSVQTGAIANTGVDQAKMMSTLFDQIAPTGKDNFFATVSAAQASVANQAAALPDPASPDSIRTFSARIPGNDDTLLLQAEALPSFAHPLDPVVLVGGITPPQDAPDKGAPLPCRVSCAAVTGVTTTIDGHALTVDAGTGSLPRIIPDPTLSITGTGQPLSTLLDPAVAEAVAALAVETFFADPNNAASILLNGVNCRDASTIAALAAAMAAGTAQTAEIAEPLRARFAFAPWEQAWAPLFLEWKLQFRPTVGTDFTGQALPPPALQPTTGTAVQDNLPMDLAGWRFDGGGDLAARGWEPYSWTGGDIWKADPWLVPQQFVGRSALTPNVETLFLARLEEYVADQPVASAVAVVTDGVLTAVHLIGGGAGYEEAPAIALTGGGGSGAAAIATVAGGAVIAIAVTDGGSGYTSPPDVAIAPSDWDAIRTLVDRIGATRFLSQTLSGFNDNLLMKRAMHVVSPDAATAAVVDGQNRQVPNPALGDVPFAFGRSQPFFFPARGGYFQLLQLQIVDGFGQVLDLLRANGNPSGDPAGFVPILGAGLIPEDGVASPTCQVRQAPRVVQPARLDLDWLDARDDDRRVFLDPDAGPVSGWLIPNHIDHAIAVYDAAGAALGELLVLMQAGGDRAVRWLAAVQSPASVQDPADIPDRHLAGVFTAFTSGDGGIPADERVDAFEAWFRSIDETLWTVDPPGGQSNEDLAVLIGRPLALARMRVRLELYGAPAANGSWRDTFDLADPADPSSLEVGRQHAGLESLRFPIQLGSTELLDDGVIGYFTGDDYRRFNAVHAAATPASAYVAPVGGENCLALLLDDPGGGQALSILLDPFGTVHATTGILPVADTALPADFYVPVLSRLALSFRIGPVLTSPAAVRLPVPIEQAGVWSWVWQTAPGSFAVSDVVAASDRARLADAPPALVEGWLVLAPSEPPPAADDSEPQPDPGHGG